MTRTILDAIDNHGTFVFTREALECLTKAEMTDLAREMRARGFDHTWVSGLVDEWVEVHKPTRTPFGEMDPYEARIYEEAEERYFTA